MIPTLNPYPKQPGFGRRVAHAKRALKQLTRKPWNRSPVSSPDFESCFEHDDKNAVVWALMDAARSDHKLFLGIICLDGRRCRLLKDWYDIYLFPWSLSRAFQQASLPRVDLISPVQ